MLNVMALHTAMLGVCISTYLDATIFKITQVLMTKESIPVACRIQQEGTLMSVLGYIVMTILVSYSCFNRCCSLSSSGLISVACTASLLFIESASQDGQVLCIYRLTNHSSSCSQLHPVLPVSDAPAPPQTWPSPAPPQTHLLLMSPGWRMVTHWILMERSTRLTRQWQTGGPPLTRTHL